MQETTSPRASARLDSNLIIRIVLWFALAVITFLVANAALQLPGRQDQVIVRLVTDLLIIAGGFFEVWLLTQRGLQNAYRRFQSVLALQFGALIFQRVYTVLFVEAAYGPEIWVRFALAGLIIGSVYALIAIGYTLVYGILFMINFAHGDVMMLGAFGAFFTFEALNGWIVDPVSKANFLNTYPVIAVILAFAVGMTTSMLAAITLERIAYRPLRAAPRLVPLISAIGSSIFIAESARLMFSSQTRPVRNPSLLTRGEGFDIFINNSPVRITYTGIFTLVLAIILLSLLFTTVQRTKLGRAMRAVAQDKRTAALMGINVDSIISRTFAISGLLAGAAGVTLAIHQGQVVAYMGFGAGIKAFTSAVLGGIGNIPGAMVGGLVLGIIENVGPAALAIDFQLKDVIGFSILVLMLVFRPTGLLGEALSEEKV